MANKSLHPSPEVLSLFHDKEGDSQLLKDLQEHVNACPECRSRLLVMGKLSDELQELPNIPAPESIMEAVQHVTQRATADTRAVELQPKSRSGRTQWPMRIAALFVIGACLAAFWHFEKNSTPEVAKEMASRDVASGSSTTDRRATDSGLDGGGRSGSNSAFIDDDSLGDGAAETEESPFRPVPNAVQPEFAKKSEPQSRQERLKVGLVDKLDDAELDEKRAVEEKINAQTPGAAGKKSRTRSVKKSAPAEPVREPARSPALAKAKPTAGTSAADEEALLLEPNGRDDTGGSADADLDKDPNESDQLAQKSTEDFDELEEESAELAQDEAAATDAESIRRESTQPRVAEVPKMKPDELSEADRIALQETAKRALREQEELKRAAEEKAQLELIARDRERAEQERVAREKAERERLAKEKAKRERIAREKAEQQRLAREKAERERIALAEAARRAKEAVEKLMASSHVQPVKKASETPAPESTKFLVLYGTPDSLQTLEHDLRGWLNPELLKQVGSYANAKIPVTSLESLRNALKENLRAGEPDEEEPYEMALDLQLTLSEYQVLLRMVLNPALVTVADLADAADESDQERTPVRIALVE